MHHRIFTLAAMCLLTACGGDIGKAQDEVKRRLYDGSSAEFRDDRVLYLPPGRDKIVCGEVNAKSPQGGYSGFQPYVVENLDVAPFAKFSQESAQDIRVTCSLGKP
ncbi:hypothetical protein RRX38_02870 [Pseudomonas sp. DTU_2021_1001937_2_SI_NGA_ILE_001]|uniref:hypothetical protein n=1 Tax=Pseudomonas sp. DTU_2021_1001937_2_SI_NGA_ILE_001 TaxID=3077589 RepID=UPI0028FC2304|nr:hypothetical protein [Pseudomonas sp. DTU_2021_1001937_2_SI_NGA_ILE_001]WNW10132.1 hypothetical protein RRX38_02870 [Pseudomonas sp. DTU_2021_1001937_2_SI_NGA_ILE_001]